MGKRKRPSPRYKKSCRRMGIYVDTDKNIKYELLLLKIEMVARSIRVLDPRMIFINCFSKSLSGFEIKFVTSFGLSFLKRKLNRGSFTNPLCSENLNPKLFLSIFSYDEYSLQKETSNMGIPNFCFCKISDSAVFADLCVPYREERKFCLSLIFYVLSRCMKNLLR